MLLATTCPVCGAQGGAPCRRCAGALRPAPHLPPPHGVDGIHALLAYEGAGRELVARLKYRNQRAALPGLAAAMATLVDPATADLVTWPPTTAARRRGRGFDHAALLAQEVARRLGRPPRRLLARAAGEAQTGRSLAERRVGPVFRARAAVPGRRILLVDDVVTSGATVAAAAHALRRAGAASVVVLAAARTGLKPRSGASDTLGDAGQ